MSNAGTTLVLLFGLLGAPTFAQPLDVLLDRLVADGRIVGAQAMVAQRDVVLLEHWLGTVSVDSDRKVDGDTRFCIGSCSKPFTAAVIMRLVEEGKMGLDEPIDVYLPEFGSLRVEGGEPAGRAPTLRELLCHRSGVYSQKRRVTPAQMRLIRDFRLTLKQSVDGIARQELFAQPGREYAYSGAGYCVIGRVAEAVTSQSFEQVFQRRLAGPLGLERTTYFPSAEDKNIAAGAALKGERLQTNSETPHEYGAELRFPLIGGSLYSTARETTRFARMIADRGRVGSTAFLSDATWQELVGQQGDQLYGLGWRLVVRDGRTVRLYHNGSLASSRSRLRIDLESGRTVVVHYTVADPGDMELGALMDEAVERALSRKRR